MKVYEIKNLIEGYKIDPLFKGMTLVCCKSDSLYTHIKHNNEIMFLTDPLCGKPFLDKYGRGVYFLNYYEWKPQELWGN